MSTTRSPILSVGGPSGLPTAGAGAPMVMDLFEKSDAETIAGATIILYGASGLAKSTNAKFFARYMYEKSGGKPVRLVTFEDSTKLIFQPLIDSQIVQPLFVTKSTNPLVLLRRVSKGDWPIFDDRGGVKGWQAKADWVGQISAYVIEGLSSGSEQLLEFFREMGWFLREQKADSIDTLGEKFSTSSQTSYGVVQLEMLRALKSFGMLPVDRILWTAHEGSGVEDSEAIRGPALVGKAGTGAIQKYCGLLIHAEGVKEANSAVFRPRFFFKRHADPKLTTISYPAKTTMPSEMVVDLDKTFPGGFFDPALTYGTGLDKFLKFEAELIKTATDQISAWKAGIKGEK